MQFLCVLLFPGRSINTSRSVPAAVVSSSNQPLSNGGTYLPPSTHITSSSSVPHPDIASAPHVREGSMDTQLTILSPSTGSDAPHHHGRSPFLPDFSLATPPQRPPRTHRVPSYENYVNASASQTSASQDAPPIFVVPSSPLFNSVSFSSPGLANRKNSRSNEGHSATSPVFVPVLSASSQQLLDSSSTSREGESVRSLSGSGDLIHNSPYNRLAPESGEVKSSPYNRLKSESEDARQGAVNPVWPHKVNHITPALTLCPNLIATPHLHLTVIGN